MRHNNNSDKGSLLSSTLLKWWNFIINWWRSFDPNAMQSHDTLLKNYMKPVGLTTWKQLRDHAKISRSTLHYLRTGQADHLPVYTLKAIAQHLHTDWTKLLQDFSNTTLPNLGEQYYQECQRLQEQLDNSSNSTYPSDSGTNISENYTLVGTIPHTATSGSAKATRFTCDYRLKPIKKFRKSAPRLGHRTYWYSLAKGYL
jgi:hypothetical protein